MNSVTTVLAARGGALLRRIRRIAGESERASCGTECLAAGSGALLTVVLLVVLALHAVGVPAAKADEEKILAVMPPPQGVVVDPTGAPVSGARVLLYHHKSVWGLGNAIVEETTSTADGSFALHAQLDFTSRREDFQDDHYILAAAHPGLAPGWSVIYGRQSVTPRVRLTLTPPETRVFQVKDKTGKPLAGASVWISAMGNMEDSNAVLRAYAVLPEDIGLVSGLSDESGTVRLPNVPATDCGFHASKTGFATTWAGHGREKGWDVTLSPAACVEGTAVDPQGRPVTNFVIWAKATWPLWQFWSASTDTNGHFRFETLYGKGGSWDGDGGTGEYELMLRDERFMIKPIPVNVEMGQHVDVGQVRLKAASRCLLRGRLLDPATKAPLAGVSLLCDAGNDRRRIETAADGTFSLRVPYGKVDIEWDSEQWNWCPLNDDDSGELYRGAVSAPIQDLTLYANGVVQRLTAISGRAEMPDGKPAGNVTLAIVGLSTSMTWTANCYGRGSLPFKTEPDGSFRCAAVPCGIPLQLCAVSDDAACTAIAKLPPLDPRGCDLGDLKLQPATPRRFRIVDEQGNPWRNRKLRLTLATLASTTVDIRRFGRTLTTDGQGVACMDAALPGVPYLLKLEKSELYSREFDFAELIEKNGVPPDLTLTVSSRVPEDTPLAVHVVGPENRTIEPAEFPDFEAKTKDGWWRNGALKIDKRLEDGRCSIVRKTLCVVKPGAPIHVLVVAKDGQRFVAAGIIPSGTNELVLQAQDLPPPMDVANEDLPGGVAPDQIAGRVVNEAGKPVPGAVISLQPAFDKERTVTTDVDGIFRFDGKKGVLYAPYLQVEAEGYARRWISRFPKGQGFRVLLGTTTRFAGRLTASNGKPVGTVAIQLLTSLLPRTGASLDPQPIDNIPLGVTTKEDGSYDFPVQPGTYNLQATNSLGLVASAERVAIRAGTVSALPLQLRPGARVKLRAVDCITGAPAVGVPLSIWESSSLRGLWTKPGSQRVTDKDGVAEWDGLFPGKIELSCDRMVVFGYPVPEGQTPYQRWWSTSDACRASLPVDGDYVRHPPQMGGGIGELYIDVRDNLPTVIVQMERGFRVKGRVTSRTGALPEHLGVSLVVEGGGAASSAAMPATSCRSRRMGPSMATFRPAMASATAFASRSPASGHPPAPTPSRNSSTPGLETCLNSP